jgi:TrmH family RNA methyltransferase
MPAPIASRNHDVVKKLRRLNRKTYRDRSGTFLVEGMNLLNEAMASGARIRELAFVDSRSEEAEFILSRQPGGAPAHVLSRELMGWVSDVVTSQGMIGVVDQPDTGLDSVPLKEATLVMVASRVRDPGNMGSLLRIADASAVDAFVATEECVDLYNPKVVRTAAGAHFHLRIAAGVSLAELRRFLEGRMELLGLDAAGTEDYLAVDMTRPMAIVVGNEAFGIAEVDSGFLDRTVRVDMPGRAESLNVAAAAAVVMFEALRQRRISSGGCPDRG